MSLYKVVFILTAASIGIATYFGIDCYLFGIADKMQRSSNIYHETATQSPSSANCASQYYYQKQVEFNCTFSVYLVQIGKLLATSMNQSQIEQLSDMIEQDLISTKSEPHKDSISGQTRKELFRSYFRDAHNIEAKQQQSCKHQDERMDFFQFIQNDLNQTNNANDTTINFYGSLPINNVLGINQFVSHSKHKYDHINDSYFPPKLFSYTLSVDSTGDLPSLELRFAEICGQYQQRSTKHTTLNRNQPLLLWAGEMYYFYDYKYRRYVLVMDNSSGHWKPQAVDTPKYLERLLYRALFPDYNISLLSQREDMYTQVDFYRPLMLMAHFQEWTDLKRVMFPVLAEVDALYALHRHGKSDTEDPDVWQMLAKKWNSTSLSVKDMAAKLMRHHTQN